jgi:SnoaL-like domain
MSSGRFVVLACRWESWICATKGELDRLRTELKDVRSENGELQMQVEFAKKSSDLVREREAVKFAAIADWAASRSYLGGMADRTGTADEVGQMAPLDRCADRGRRRGEPRLRVAMRKGCLMDATRGPMSPAEVISAWRTAGERADVQAAAQCLADDVEVISPLTAQFRFRGRDQVREMLSAAFKVITGIRYHTVIGEGRVWALYYYGRVGRHELEEAQLLRLDDAGLIRELTLFGRPLPALTAMMAGIGPRLLRRQGRPRLATVVNLATVPLHAMARLGEQRLVPLADPGRPRAERST